MILFPCSFVPLFARRAKDKRSMSYIDDIQSAFDAHADIVVDVNDLTITAAARKVADALK